MKWLVGFLLGVTMSKNLSAQVKDSIQQYTKKTAHLYIFPNPAHNKIVLAMQNFAAGKVVVKIADAQGRLLREEERYIIGANDQVTMMFNWPPGMYALIIQRDW